MMAIVEITDDTASVPIRIEVADLVDQDAQDFYESRETRGINRATSD